MEKYEFTIIDEPKGKQRPRFGHGRVYTPNETVQYEKFVRTLYHGQKFDGALTVRIKACYKPPRKCNEPYPTKKPDADNVAKIILDALNGVAWDDDKQVVNLLVAKRWSKVPMVVVSIERADI